MTPSPVEELALAYVEHQPELAALMRAQFQKGRAEYGHPIDAWPALLPEQVAEAQKELLDAIVYFNKIDRHAFVLECHRLASMCVMLTRYRDRQAGEPMRSVKESA